MYTDPGDALFLGVLRDGLRNDNIAQYAQHVVLLAHRLHCVDDGRSRAAEVVRDDRVEPAIKMGNFI